MDDVALFSGIETLVGVCLRGGDGGGGGSAGRANVDGVLVLVLVSGSRLTRFRITCTKGWFLTCSGLTRMS